MIHHAPGFTLKTPELLGHDEVREYELLSSKVVRYPSDVEDIMRTIRLASKKVPVVVAILAPKMNSTQGGTYDRTRR
jgi:esterase/lipase